VYYILLLHFCIQKMMMLIYDDDADNAVGLS